MSEKRKPTIVVSFKVLGRKHLVELFPSSLWPATQMFSARPFREKRYRVRVNGKWAKNWWTVSAAVNAIRLQIVTQLKRKKPKEQ